MNYYEHHLGDYAKDAAHLSLVEDGAYRRLLDAYYTREQPLPGDVKLCCKLARATTKAERDAVKYVLGEFFDLREGGYHQSRADQEIERFRAKSEKAKRSAAARWSNREAHSEGNANASPDAMRTHSEGNAPRARPQSPDPNQKQAIGNSPPDCDSSQGASAPESGGCVAAAVEANPALPAVVRLRKLGDQWLRLTPSNPEIITAIREGVSVEDIEAMAEAYPDKPPLYAIRAARRDHAETPEPITPGGPHAARSPSRKLSAVERVEAAIHERRAAAAGIEPAGLPLGADGSPLRQPLDVASG